MSRMYVGLSSLALVFVVLLYFTLPGTAAPPQAGGQLPGAIATIHARNYPTLQAALDALPPQGGLVQLPAGTFEIEQPLRLTRGDVCLLGSGTATHIKNMNREGKPALLLTSASDEKKTEGDAQLWRIRLANFRITGNPKSGHGIVADDINEVHLDGVTVSYHGGDGIRLDHCYEDARVTDCLITYNKAVGLKLLGCHDIVVSACHFEENQDAVHCLNGFNLCMTGCCADDHLGRGVVIENTYGSVVSGNMLEECHDEAIVLDRDCYGIALSANVIAHNGGGVDLRDAHGCTVSANTFTILKQAAVRIGPASGRITVTGNNFSNSYIGENKVKRGENDRAAAGLVLDGGKHSSIVGNVFSGLTTPAVELSDKPSQGILFGENVLVDVESQHEQLPDVPGESK